MPIPTKLLHISLSTELINRIDASADHLCVNRSEFIRRAVTEKLRNSSQNVFPGSQGVDILMTDDQLIELQAIILLERRRRTQRKADYLQRRQDLLR